MPKRKKATKVVEQPSEQAKLASLAEYERLREFINLALGDPRLTAWEANFVISMRRYAEMFPALVDSPTGWRLSQKRLGVIEEIWKKLDPPIPADDPEVAEFRETDPDAPEPVDEDAKWRDLLGDIST